MVLPARLAQAKTRNAKTAELYHHVRLVRKGGDASGPGLEHFCPFMSVAAHAQRAADVVQNDLHLRHHPGKGLDVGKLRMEAPQFQRQPHAAKEAGAFDQLGAIQYVLVQVAAFMISRLGVGIISHAKPHATEPAFGGIDILVPRGWRITTSSTPLFAGVEDKTDTNSELAEDAPTLQAIGFVRREMAAAFLLPVLPSAALAGITIRRMRTRRPRRTSAAARRSSSRPLVHVPRNACCPGWPATFERGTTCAGLPGCTIAMPGMPEAWRECDAKPEAMAKNREGTVGHAINPLPGSQPAGRALGACLLYTSDADDDLPCVDLGRCRIIKK